MLFSFFLFFFLFLPPHSFLGRYGNKFSVEAVVLCMKGHGSVVDLAVLD